MRGRGRAPYDHHFAQDPRPMTDISAPAGATPSLGLDHREVFARFVDRLAARLARIAVERRAHDRTA